MIGIVIVAHGGLAREYLSAVEHVVGRQDGVRAIAIEDDSDVMWGLREIEMANNPPLIKRVEGRFNGFTNTAEQFCALQ